MRATPRLPRTVHALRFRQKPVLLVRPRRLLDARVQVVEPALATLLPDAARHARGNLRPLGHTSVDALDDDAVLLLSPRPNLLPRAKHLRSRPRVSKRWSARPSPGSLSTVFTVRTLVQR